MHVIGVDGSGQSDVAAAIATIGKTCKQHTVVKNPSLRTNRVNKRSASVQSFLTLSKYGVYGTKEVMIIDEQSFPSDGLLVNTTSLKKRRNGRYDLGWLYHQSVKANVTLKIVYVNRDIYQAAAIMGSENPLTTAVEFASYIAEEHARINADFAVDNFADESIPVRIVTPRGRRPRRKGTPRAVGESAARGACVYLIATGARARVRLASPRPCSCAL